MGGPRVKRHSRPNCTDLFPPRFREKTLLGRKCRLEGTEGGGEDRAEGVAYRFEDETTVPFDCLPEQGVVTS